MKPEAPTIAPGTVRDPALPRSDRTAPRHTEEDLVPLDPDHPGFRDEEYRRRRNEIARLALGYRTGDAVPRVVYTEGEQAVWRTVWEHLAPLHVRYACREWRQSAAILDLDRARIPQLSEVNERLTMGSGFQMIPVAGLIAGRHFLSEMGRGVFLSTQYVRHHTVPLYTPEPDVVHELVGHAAGLFHPAIASLSRLFGAAAARASDADMKKLELVYWYTLEFGLVVEDGVRKTYGAGLLSSFGELARIDEHPDVRPFDPEAAGAIPYDPTQYQKTLFESPSFEALTADLSAWLQRI